MMPDKTRVDQLLEELLNSNRSPEEVRLEEPDLFPEVLMRWDQLRRLENQIQALFPAPGSTVRDFGKTLVEREVQLPNIDGYEVKAVLGRGGMGVVFKAKHLKLDRTVALKMLLGGDYAGPLELARFRREATAVAGLRHPQIVQVYDVGDLTGRPYFTMEFVEGGNLDQYLAKALPNPRQAAELVATLAVAVQFAHKSGIIHRDLKPANILLTSDGLPKITDFGLARPVDGGAKFTMSGVRVGTPSYMAPEQALGKVREIGPAVDIYALGAVLYEALTGRPPFQGETAAETERQVIAQEPAPPSRLNSNVPRDLETICLKCLHKNPARRYASAQDLADDLHRFLDGKPVLARPVNVIERAVKWARRRPTAATLFAALLILLAGGVATAVWLERLAAIRRVETANREGRAQQVIESALTRSEQLRRSERWDEARYELANAATHLADAHSEDLQSQLDQALALVRTAEELKRIRQSRVAMSMGVFDYVLATTKYAKAFSEAGLTVDGDLATAAAQVQASPIRDQLLTALDDWALVAYAAKPKPLIEKVDRLLALARLADPDPVWRDRFRDRASWDDRQTLLALAGDASKSDSAPPTHQLALLGVLLDKAGEHSVGVRLLADVQRRRPGDYWLNWEMACANRNAKNHQSAVAFFRAALAARPEDSNAHNALGAGLAGLGQIDESIAVLHRAIELDRRNWIARRNLAKAFIGAGRIDEAIAESKRQIAAEPENAEAVFTLGLVFSMVHRPEEAIPFYSKVIEIDPGYVFAHCNLGFEYGRTKQFEKSAAAFRKALQLDPTSTLVHHGNGETLRNLGRHEEAIVEFEWIIRELEPGKNLSSEDFEGGFDFMYRFARINLPDSLIALGRFADADAAIQRALDIPRLDESPRKALRQQFELCRRLAPVAAKMPEFLAGREVPADIAAQQALAEWCYKYRRRAALAARLYGSLFAKQPALAKDLESHNLYQAACAAALAGSGLGDEAGNLDDNAKTAFRNQALDWLKANLDVWTKRHRSGTPVDRTIAADAARQWQRNDDLAGVREPAELSKLPDHERVRWTKLWADVETLASSDPLIKLDQARLLVSRRQWSDAAEAYAQLIQNSATNEGEIWFECAAAQLLAGDRRGYRETCKRMLEGSPKVPRMRGYLVARACTLAPDSVDDAALLSQVSAKELQDAAKTFWSLTEQGALHYRSNRFREAERSLKQSLRVETRPGASVLNWLWLAMAYQKMGENDEARHWLNKAASWMDQYGNEMPPNAEVLGLHRHNWLEAHILRQEAEKIITCFQIVHPLAWALGSLTAYCTASSIAALLNCYRCEICGARFRYPCPTKRCPECAEPVGQCEDDYWLAKFPARYRALSGGSSDRWSQ
jgi:tetratricopeptide (TPR) repeat protein